MKPFLICLFLAGCTAGTSGFRDSSAPFASTTRFDWEAFGGTWFEVGRLGARDPGAPQRRFVSEGEGEATRYRLVDPRTACIDDPLGAVCNAIGSEHLATNLRRTGVPARFEYDLTAPDPAQTWVLWVDESYRTALLARPDGLFAIILDRSARPAPDRYAAAKEILDFNGYDTLALQEVRP